MYFKLFLTLNGVDNGIVGPFVHNPQNDPRVVYYPFENDWDDVDLFEDDGAINEIAKRCDSLIGYGETDYFNSEKCVLLLVWIEERLTKPTIPRYRELLEVLKNFCVQAINLKTGVVIDF